MPIIIYLIIELHNFLFIYSIIFRFVINNLFIFLLKSLCCLFYDKSYLFKFRYLNKIKSMALDNLVIWGKVVYTCLGQCGNNPNIK